MIFCIKRYEDQGTFRQELSLNSNVSGVAKTTGAGPIGASYAAIGETCRVIRYFTFRSDWSVEVLNNGGRQTWQRRFGSSRASMTFFNEVTTEFMRASMAFRNEQEMALYLAETFNLEPV